MVSGMRRDDSKLGVDNTSYLISLFPDVDLVSTEEGITSMVGSVASAGKLC
jgi:hypothetical protein